MKWMVSDALLGYGIPWRERRFRWLRLRYEWGRWYPLKDGTHVWVWEAQDLRFDPSVEDMRLP